MSNMLTSIEIDVAKAVVRAALTDVLKGAVDQHKATPEQVAYIQQGMSDAIEVAFNEFLAGKS